MLKFLRKFNPAIVFLGGVLLIALVLSLTGVEAYRFKTILIKILQPYLQVTAAIADFIIHSVSEEVHIENMKIVSTSDLEYFTHFSELIRDWPYHLLFLRWSSILTFAIWTIRSSIRKKVIWTMGMVPIHLFGVVAGLLTLSIINPYIYNAENQTYIIHSVFGSFFFFAYFLWWFSRNKNEINQVLNNSRVKKYTSLFKTREVLWAIFFLFILKYLIVPAFSFSPYIHFLLIITSKIALWFGYPSTIDGHYLVGVSGNLFIAKWCLGFITMYVFSSVVFLTRKTNLSAWIYILTGIFLFHLLNIVRLVILFLYMQKHSDIHLFMDHHDLYNIIIYLLIFALWILWFERYSIIGTKRKPSDE
jgi:exosortase/archaeosortase family protein